MFDPGKLPTDNLYKLMALSGLLLFVLCRFILPAYHESEKIVEQEVFRKEWYPLEAEIDGANTDWVVLEKRLRKLKDNADTLKSEARGRRQRNIGSVIERAIQEATTLRLEAEKLREESDNDPSKMAKSEAKIIEADNVLREAKSELNKFDVQLLAINDRVVQVVKKVQEQGPLLAAQDEMARKLARQKALNESTEAKLKRVKDLVELERVVSWIGLGLGIVGFHLWYFKVQRYQDRLLKNEWKKSQSTENPPNTSSHNQFQVTA